MVQGGEKAKHIMRRKFRVIISEKRLIIGRKIRIYAVQEQLCGINTISHFWGLVQGIGQKNRNSTAFGKNRYP